MVNTLILLGFPPFPLVFFSFPFLERRFPKSGKGHFSLVQVFTWRSLSSVRKPRWERLMWMCQKLLHFAFIGNHFEDVFLKDFGD